MTPEERLDWLKRRQKGLGGSDIAAILKLNPYKSPLDVYLSKVEEITKADEPISEAAAFGIKLEDFVAREFAERTGLKIQRVNSTLTCVEKPWRLANIDRAIVNPTIAGRVNLTKDPQPGEPLITTDAILECKTASQYMDNQWGPTQEHEIVNGLEPEDHKIPLYYETQIQWYMGVTGSKVAYVAVLIGSCDFRIYKVPRNDALIEALFERCDEFWQESVLKKIPPEPVNVEDIKKLYTRDNGEMIEADNDDAVLIGELRTVKEKLATLKKAEASLQNQIITKLKDKTGMTLGGEKVLTYKAQTTSRIDSARLKAEEPAIFNEYINETTTRVFRLSK